MKLPRVRFTVRRMMVAVAIMAVACLPFGCLQRLTFVSHTDEEKGDWLTAL